tara:strand:+ start:681 stop:1886 length:1206 start_codon:yes stop_codon:yes gene_type:complete
MSTAAIAEEAGSGRLADLEIATVEAHALNVPATIEVAGARRDVNLSVCICEIETKGGIRGHGFTAITEEEVVATIVSEILAPALVGECALDYERLWERLYWIVSPRGQTGYAAHAMAAVDIALWDIRGKALGQPIWRLMGGARKKVPVYTTFGFAFLDRDQLVEAARLWISRGHSQLKMTVGAEALQRRDTGRTVKSVIEEDARRVLAVREAVGPDVELFIDANCSLDEYHAFQLAQAIAPARIGFFEEPIAENDARLLADLRRRLPIQLAGGQNEGLAHRFRDLLVHQAVDVLQPNVTIGGGFTQAARVAGMASAFNIPIANGGGWPFHNMHLHGGVANGGLVEYHHPAVVVCQQLFTGLPEPVDGYLTLPETPGLGFDLDRDAVAEFAARPSARGRGKG